MGRSKVSVGSRKVIVGELYSENRATLVWIFECSMVRFRICYYSCCRGLLLDVGVCDQKGHVSRSARRRWKTILCTGAHQRLVAGGEVEGYL